jgi:hypothetical protein
LTIVGQIQQQCQCRILPFVRHFVRQKLKFLQKVSDIAHIRKLAEVTWGTYQDKSVTDSTEPANSTGSQIPTIDRGVSKSSSATTL